MHACNRRIVRVTWRDMGNVLPEPRPYYTWRDGAAKKRATAHATRPAAGRTMPRRCGGHN